MPDEPEQRAQHRPLPLPLQPAEPNDPPGLQIKVNTGAGPGNGQPPHTQHRLPHRNGHRVRHTRRRLENLPSDGIAAASATAAFASAIFMSDGIAAAFGAAVFVSVISCSDGIDAGSASGVVLCWPLGEEVG